MAPHDTVSTCKPICSAVAKFLPQLTLSTSSKPTPSSSSRPSLSSHSPHLCTVSRSKLKDKGRMISRSLPFSSNVGVRADF